MLGAHVDSSDPLTAAEATGAEAIQFFLADPQGWKKPVEHEHADALRATDLTIYIHAPYLVNVASTNNKIRIPSRKILSQHAEAAASIGAKGLIVHGGHVTAKDDPAVGFDNWRKTFERAQGGRRLPAADPDREHRRRRQRDGAPLRPARHAVGRRGRVRARASCSTPATPGPAARRSPTSSTGSGRSPGGSISCTRTTRATTSTPAPTGTPTSTPATFDSELIASVCRDAGCDVIVETPGGPDGQGADIDYLRKHLR